MPMDRIYRPLAPAQRASGRSRSPVEQSETPLSKKRKSVRVACENCRTKKTACDARRPSCTYCSRKKQACVYRDPGAVIRENFQLRRTTRDQSEILDLLTSLPENEAFETLKRLRAARSLSRILASLQGSMDGRQRPSLSIVNRALCPPTTSVLEFELTELHPTIYPKLVPLLSESLEEQLREGSAQLIYEAPSKLSRRVPTGMSVQLAQRGSVPKMSSDPPRSPLLEIGAASRQTGPLQAKGYCDARLQKLDISFWTKADVSDDYAASLVSFYLEKFHPLFACFDADLFLTDLIEHRERFCSSFLVNALLYNAAQQYVAIDIRAAELVRAFLREAEKSWNSEKHLDSVMTLSASQLLGVGCHTYGPDGLAQEVTYAGRKMAKRLGLIDVPGDDWAAQAWEHKSPDWRIMAAYTAWGSYNWFSMHCVYYFDEPIEHPPNLPIPGNEDEWRDIDDLERNLTPNYAGRSFPVQCKFWCVAREVTAMYYQGSRGCLTDIVPLSFIEAAYRKLLYWTDTLTETMTREQNSPEHVILFHVLFHSIVVQIFQPFAQEPYDGSFQTFSCAGGTPKMILTASINQLKRLISTYYKKYRGAPLSSWYNPGLLNVSQALLKDQSDPDWRLYLSLCIRAWLQLYLTYPIYLDITQAFLAMAIRDNLMSAKDSNDIMTEFYQVGRHHERAEEPISTFVTDFDLALTGSTGLQSARINSLAETFTDMTLFEEFTTGDCDSLQ